MDQLTAIFAAFQMHNWYALAALVLMGLLQVIRSNRVPFLTKLWYRVPDGWRWLGPLLFGASTAFVTAFANGLSFAQACAAIVGGIFGIGFPSMGIHAAAKESPVHIDGGPGGQPLEPVVPA